MFLDETKGDNMNSKSIQTSYNKVPKRKTSKVPAQASSRRHSAPVLGIRKEINPVALLIFLAVWTLVTAQIVYLIAGKGADTVSKKDLRNIEYKIQKLTEASQQTNTIVVERESRRAGSRGDAAKREMVKLREQIIDEVNRLNNKYHDVIVAKDSKNLKAMQELVERGPASIGEKKGQVLTYNVANADVFAYKLRLEYKRAERNLEEEKKIFMASLNLNSADDQKKLEQFNDDVKVKLYELRAHHRSLKNKFQVQKYIILDNS